MYIHTNRNKDIKYTVLCFSTFCAAPNLTWELYLFFLMYPSAISVIVLASSDETHMGNGFGVVITKLYNMIFRAKFYCVIFFTAFLLPVYLQLAYGAHYDCTCFVVKKIKPYYKALTYRFSCYGMFYRYFDKFFIFSFYYIYH